MTRGLPTVPSSAEEDILAKHFTQAKYERLDTAQQVGGLHAYIGYIYSKPCLAPISQSHTGTVSILIML